MTHILKSFILTALLTLFASQANAIWIQPDWYEVTDPGVGTNRYAYSGNDPINRLDPNGNFFTWEDVRNTIGRAFGESQETRNGRNADALSRAQSELDRFETGVNNGEYDFLSGIAQQEALDARRDRVSTYSRRVRNAQGSAAVDALIMGATMGGLKAGVAGRGRIAASQSRLAIEHAELAAAAGVSFKGTAQTVAGRALTKHPNAAGFETAEQLSKSLRSPQAINEAASQIVGKVLSNGSRTQRTHNRFGDVIEYTLGNGIGARFNARTSEFIGFLGR